MNILLRNLTSHGIRSSIVPASALALVMSLSIAIISAPHSSAASTYVISRCGGPVSLIGHRGTDDGVRANTIAAFKKAAAAGADSIELDVHRSKPNSAGSGTWVVNHDSFVTDSAGKKYTIATTSIETLRKVRPDMPTIRDAMKYISTTGALMEMEIKPSTIGNGSLNYFASLSKEFNMQQRLSINSFHSSVLKQFVALKTGAATTGYISTAYPTTKPADIKKFASSISMKSTATNATTVKALKAAGLKVYTYTIDSESDWNKYIGYGIDGVITDRTASYNNWCAGIQ